jgi:hypothetical protein
MIAVRSEGSSMGGRWCSKSRAVARAATGPLRASADPAIKRRNRQNKSSCHPRLHCAFLLRYGGSVLLLRFPSACLYWLVFTWFRRRPSAAPAAPSRWELPAIHRCPLLASRSSSSSLARCSAAMTLCCSAAQRLCHRFWPVPAGDGALRSRCRHFRQPARIPAPIPQPGASFSGVRSSAGVRALPNSAPLQARTLAPKLASACFQYRLVRFARPACRDSHSHPFPAGSHQSD